MPYSCTILLASAFIFLFASACSQGGPDDQSETGTLQEQVLQAPLQRRVMTHQGIEREFFVYLPTAITSGKPLPVVVMLHGYTSTATGFQAYHGTSRHAEAHDYIAVYPQGSHFLAGPDSGPRQRITSWNDLAANLATSEARPHCAADGDSYPCPPECGVCSHCAWTSCYDDLGFLSEMLDALAEEFNTDTRRYYLLGVSNGGMMALRAGCNLSARFAAVAPIIAQLAPGFACSPSTDLPLLHLFGARDDSVRFDGKPGTDGFIYTSAKETAATWAAGMECKSGPQPWRQEFAERAGLQCTSYSDCRHPGQEVVSCMDPQGGHVWPSQRVAGVPATCVTPAQAPSMPGQEHCLAGSVAYTHWGMDLIWEFMRRYQIPD